MSIQGTKMNLITQRGGILSRQQPVPLNGRQEVLQRVQETKGQKKLTWKEITTGTLNIGSALLNLAAFVNGNLNFRSDLQDKIKSYSDFSTKAAISLSGVISAVDTLNKNSLAFAGWIVEAMIPVISSKYDVWLFRGLSQSTINTKSILDNKPIYDVNGNHTKDLKGKEQHVGGTYIYQEGEKRCTKACIKATYKDTVETTKKELPDVYSRLIQKPSRIKDYSYALTFSSTFQFLGGLIALFGFRKLGAGIRDFGGTCADFAFMCHKDREQKDSSHTKVEAKEEHKFSLSKILDFKSDFVKAGVIWIGAAIVDFFKRFDFFESRINNLTELSLASDRCASAFFISANLKNS